MIHLQTSIFQVLSRCSGKQPPASGSTENWHLTRVKQPYATNTHIHDKKETKQMAGIHT